MGHSEDENGGDTEEREEKRLESKRQSKNPLNEFLSWLRG